MPEKKTVERARKDAREGKAPTTQAGEFVREEIEHVRKGKHGARSTKQAIAIGLSKARQAGVKLPPPKKGQAKEKTRRSAERAYEKGQASRRGEAGAKQTPSPRRSRAVKGALQREGHEAASSSALSRQAKTSRPARKTATTARKAATTKRKAATTSRPARKTATTKRKAATTSRPARKTATTKRKAATTSRPARRTATTKRKAATTRRHPRHAKSGSRRASRAS